VTAVSLVRCAEYQPQLVDEALQLALAPFGGLGGVSGFARTISRGSKVLIKPNFLRAASAEAALSPHPQLVRALIEELHSLGANIKIGDSPAFGTARGVAEATGIAAVADAMGVPVVEFRNPIKLEAAGFTTGSLQIDREVIESDAVINLCKLKSHSQMLMTGAVKNLFGCITGKRKPLWHMRLGDRDNLFAELMVALYREIGPIVSICDAILAMEGNGPGKGDPRYVGLLLAAEDGVALDTVLAEVVGHQSQELRILRAARDLACGTSRLEDIELHGNLSLEEARIDDWKLPEPMAIAFGPMQVVRSAIKQVGIRSRRLLETPGH
jgi:uncharacterized protein (DUF362 family)